MIKIAKTSKEIRQALDVRYDVLLKPQGYGPEDVKKYDLNDDPITVICADGDKIVASATAFILPTSESKLIYLAVLPEYQRKGIGKDLVRAIECELKKRGVNRSLIQARTYLKDFYTSLGYEPAGEIERFPGFEEKGIFHQQMARKL